MGGVYAKKFQFFGNENIMETEDAEGRWWKECEEEDDAPAEDVEMGQNGDKVRFRRQTGYSLKRLVRLLHISNPPFHVMAILGKR